MKAPDPIQDIDRDWEESIDRQLLAREVAETIASELPLSKGMEVLDYGCGTGHLGLALRSAVGPILGVDSSESHLQRLTHKLWASGIADFTTQYHPSFPLALDRRFHLIASHLALHRVVDIPALLKQMVEHLHPGGWLALADLSAEDGSFHPDPSGVQHWGFSPAKLTAWLKAESLELESVRVIPATSVRRHKRRYGVNLALGRKRP